MRLSRRISSISHGSASTTQIFNGIRAGAKQLIKDNQAHGLKTIRALVSDHVYGWAPASDCNDDAAYIAMVCKTSGMDANEPVSFFGTAGAKTLIAMWPGFCIQENGRCIYARDLIASACYNAVGVPYPEQGAVV